MRADDSSRQKFFVPLHQKVQLLEPEVRGVESTGNVANLAFPPACHCTADTYLCLQDLTLDQQADPMDVVSVMILVNASMHSKQKQMYSF